MCGLKKAGFFVDVFHRFRKMVFSSAVTLISLKPFFFFLQRSWSFLAYFMGYFSSLFLLIKGGYVSLLFWFGFSGLTQICVVCQIDITVKPRFTDTRLIRTPHYYRHFTFSLGKESPYIFFKFNPLNTDTFCGV